MLGSRLKLLIGVHLGLVPLVVLSLGRTDLVSPLDGPRELTQPELSLFLRAEEQSDLAHGRHDPEFALPLTLTPLRPTLRVLLLLHRLNACQLREGVYLYPANLLSLSRSSVVDLDPSKLTKVEIEGAEIFLSALGDLSDVAKQQVLDMDARRRLE